MSSNHQVRELVLVQLFELPSPMAHARQILSTACALASRGIRTHVFCRKKDSRPMRDIVADDFGLDPLEGLVVHGLSPSKGIAGLDYRRRLMQRALGASSSTVFYGRQRSQTLYVLKLARLLRRKCPVVFEFHNIESVLEQEKGTERAEQVRLEEARIVRECDALAAISQPLAEDLALEFGCELPTVIPDGVDLACFGGIGRPFSEPGGPRLVYAGSLYPYKGVGRLVDALAQLDRDVRLTVVGGNPASELAALRERVADMGDRVELTGHVEASAVPGHLARADIVMLPSGDELRTQRYSSPLKLFEAMATGIPIVAAPTDANSSILEDGVTAFLAEDCSGEGLAHAVRRVCADKAEATRIGRAALNAAKDYGWDRRAERIAALCAHANQR